MFVISLKLKNCIKTEKMSLKHLLKRYKRRDIELCLLGKKINSEQAQNLGLVNEIIAGDFLIEVQDRVKDLVLLPHGSIKESKALMRRWNREELHMVNIEECKMLVRRWQSDECMEAVQKFFQRKATIICFQARNYSHSLCVNNNIVCNLCNLQKGLCN